MMLACLTRNERPLGFISSQCPVMRWLLVCLIGNDRYQISAIAPPGGGAFKRKSLRVTYVLDLRLTIKLYLFN